MFIIGQESVLRQVIKTKETKRNTSLRKQLTELLQVMILVLSIEITFFGGNFSEELWLNVILN